jgi:hypothetical protein
MLDVAGVWTGATLDGATPLVPHLKEAAMANYVGQIKEIGGNIERTAGPDIRDRVMQGSEAITASAKPLRVALWVQGAMERLDALTPEEARQQIMMECGRSCARMNKGMIARAQKRRRRFKTEDEFLAAEQACPQAGTRLEREADRLYHFYTPHSYTRPMRCYCSLVRGLPDDRTVSTTYCQCSRGFEETYWSQVLGRPVAVDLEGSCVSGAQECTFVIHL